ncbi:TPA: polysaccharide deacetylase family protein [Candidatus Poribacteria bacterium]|nr:polysaccharide deacetylase family protein [Candidatus Poribacteria bacterium]
MSNEPVILVYHKVEAKREIGLTRISPESFRRQIEFLRSEGFTSISPYQLLDYLLHHRSPPERSVIITFDDGYEGVYRFARPILMENGFTATIFLISEFVGNWNRWDVRLCGRFKHLSADQISEMSSDGFTFGSHGATHRFLTSYSGILRRFELERSRIKLERVIGRRVDLLSYPYGDWNEDVVKSARRAGYRAAFTMNPFLPISAETIFSLPRISIYSFDTLESFRAKIGLGSQKLRLFLFGLNLMVNRCSHAGRLVHT